MNRQIEKILLIFLLKNKKYIRDVEPHFFKTEVLRIIYREVYDYITKTPSADLPHPRQIMEMVRINDPEERITKNIFKEIFSTSIKEYDEKNFILPKLKTFILSNKLDEATSKILDIQREVNSNTEIEDVLTNATKMHSIIKSASNFKLEDDDDLGTDFDDAEAHNQDQNIIKVSSGYDTIDYMLGGGWDNGTLNILMGETNSGKSLWIQNLAVKAANAGKNVLYITLEMTVKKVMKRFGAMRLRIPINQYDDLSQDTDFIKRKIDDLYNDPSYITGASGDSMFEGSSHKIGKIFTKFWAAGTATVEDFDSLIEKIEIKKGVKIDMVVVDYITLISPIKGLGFESNLYLKGKHLAEGLRAIAAKYDCPLITAIQIAKDAWNSTDITLDKIPESKAIAETADIFLAIIRTEQMRANNIYRLKLLKQRDGNFDKSQAVFDLNPEYLSIENDRFFEDN